MVFGHADISAWKALARKSLFLARRIMSFASACVAAIAAMVVLEGSELPEDP